jgi:predicted acyltransferase
MIIVNTPGAGALPYAPFEHAAWHGFTPTDLVFPSFLFAVGNAMSFSMKKYENSATGSVLLRVLKRSILIFLIGYMLYWFPFFRVNEGGAIGLSPISETRIMGVLQRIALCYFFASLLILFLSRKTVIICSIIFLLGYWILLLLFGNPTDPLSLTGNAGLYLDKFLFGDAHLYHGEGIAFDPEGVLSTIPAIVNVIAGYYAGRFIQEKGKGFETTTKLLLTGGCFILIALCWNQFFPINKKLWTSSFVLLTTGLDMAIIAALIYITEIKFWNQLNWTYFFTVFGRNPLFIYIVSGILITIMNMIPINNNSNLSKFIDLDFFQAVAPGPFGSLLSAIAYMLVCWSIGLLLDKKKIYIRV